jgi:hypothetical protein
MVYVKDAARPEEGDKLAELLRSIAEYRGGRVRDIHDALWDLKVRHLSKLKT